MTLKINSFIGKKFEKLLALEAIELTTHGWKVKFMCDCGNEKIIRLDHVKSGKTVSCGCIQPNSIKNAISTHNLTNHSLYIVRINMINRCYNIKDIGYSNYGGRGIVVCDEWKNSFICFYNWAIANGWKEGLQIDRKDNNGNYEPLNCRFVTRKINSLNRRTNRMITYKNETKPLKQWCDELNLPYKVVFNRLTRSNWSIEKAFNFNK
jgi:hypothetical protein